MSDVYNPKTVAEEPAASDAAEVTLAQCKLVVLKGAERGREIIVSGDVTRIGKSEENDVCFSEEKVSRHHCEILRDQGGYLLRDLDSTNGTFLDGTRVREAYLKPGSVIACGPVQIRFLPFEEHVLLLPSEREQLGQMRGRSLRMREIFGLIERVAPTDATVLLQGETGVGKDLVARTIHALSRRREAPFVVVDCGSVSASLIESELFGHEKGAFTGASETRKGTFEVAQGGTLFLDEMGELPVDLQPKLLRVLEQREIRRVGSNKIIKVDIRVIAATKRDLRVEVEKGRFREDLFFRLSVVPITVPPLRERKEDIPLIVEDFLDRMAEQSGERPVLPDKAMQVLMAHDWPGNVRELRNVLERAVFLGGEATAFGLMEGSNLWQAGPGVAFDPRRSHSENKDLWNEQFERRYLRWLLDRNEGNVSRAAREAQMDRKYLHRLLRRYGVDAAGGDE